MEILPSQKRHYKKPFEGSLLKNQDSTESKRVFLDGSHVSIVK